MAGCDAIEMVERSSIELRAYLRRANPDPDPDLDTFLEQVDTIFKLRVEAELNFKQKPHLAKSKRQALPLGWPTIAQIIQTDFESPPERLITQIARECLNDTEEIIYNMRKVLTRYREKVSIGMVQQVDSHCLRWLSKQPGRNAVEKAGAKQRILAIVRRENFNTLENRVFKDFLARTIHEATLYLRKNNLKLFRDHKTIKNVKRLGRICAEGLREPIMGEIGSVQELPVPNYVLRQERRYSKVWKAYCELIRQADIAERLLPLRKELAETLEKLNNMVSIHTNPMAKFHCPIWFNPLNGKCKEVIDRPFYENEIIDEAKQNNPLSTREKAETVLLPSDNVIVDLNGIQPCRDLLIYSCHNNAKPYLQNYKKPSIEDINNKKYFLTDLLRKPDSNDESLRPILHDYFVQLHAYIGGKKWFVLVPDEWDALWQETIIKSIPLPRNNVFLLWRSIAAVIGISEHLKNPHENDNVAVVDIQQGGIVRMSKLMLALDINGNSLIPQRKSFARYPNCYAKIMINYIPSNSERNAFLYGRKTAYTLSRDNLERINNFVHGVKHVVLVDNIGINPTITQWPIYDGELLTRGAERFIAQMTKGQIAYYDELEELSLIVQTEDEQVIAKPLVKSNEKSPGGKEIVTETIKRAAVFKRESDRVDLLLCMGEATPDTPLKKKTHEFNESLSEDHTIDLFARVAPGQGMAVVTVMSDFLRQPIELDFLHGMTEGQTMSYIENEMNRSFPPDSPDVVADDVLWAGVMNQIQQYLMGKRSPDGSWFAKAKKLYPSGTLLPLGSSPMERLRRKNVFGNDPKYRYPSTNQMILGQLTPSFDFKTLFKKLADDYLKYHTQRAEIIRLIAWTYASDEPAFDRIRRKAVKHVSDYANENTSLAPDIQEITLCANLCVSREEWITCLKAIEYRIKDYNNRVSHDFYLLYNLLQFHPTILIDTGYFKNDACWNLVKHIPHWYRIHRKGGVAIGYILKSLLYFLRCRRFDGKRFLTKEYDPEHYSIISKCLDSPVHRAHENLRRLVIEYLNNKGTIDGLPVD